MLIDISKIPFMRANRANYNQKTRKITSIDYIVMHYTGNINDTAYNNVAYFRDHETQSSAHFFVDSQYIYQSVPLDHTAYSVGLGSMKEPYFKYPDYWKMCNNSNSVSIEMCGGKTSREASDATKDNACKLAAQLIKDLRIPIAHVIRHYDVTGKKCPAWAVEDPIKWLDIQIAINKWLDYEDDNMRNDEQNYQVFKQFLERFFQETDMKPSSWEADAMKFMKDEGLMNDGKPKSFITRGEFATVMQRLLNKK